MLKKNRERMVEKLIFVRSKEVPRHFYSFSTVPLKVIIDG